MKISLPFKKTLLLLMLVLSSVDTGCTTKRPKPIVARQASFDGNSQDSGVKAVTNHQYAVSDELVQRYNGLILEYGDWFIPQIKTNFGVTAVASNRSEMTKEAMSRLAVMTMWHNSKPPPKPADKDRWKIAMWASTAIIVLLIVWKTVCMIWRPCSKR